MVPELYRDHKGKILIVLIQTRVSNRDPRGLARFQSSLITSVAVNNRAPYKSAGAPGSSAGGLRA